MGDNSSTSLSLSPGWRASSGSAVEERVGLSGVQKVGMWGNSTRECGGAATVDSEALETVAEALVAVEEALVAVAEAMVAVEEALVADIDALV